MMKPIKEEHIAEVVEVIRESFLTVYMRVYGETFISGGRIRHCREIGGNYEKDKRAGQRI